MYNIICVTNRALCQEDFFIRLKKIASCRPFGMILREKDLSETKYKELARQALDICNTYQVPCILHSYAKAAIELNANSIHLPLSLLSKLTDEQKKSFHTIGASCHSVKEAKAAEQLGCTYITAGHIFDTECKKGLAGRGTGFLKDVCQSVSIPVYAIGGITKDNIRLITKAGAKGACIMSGLMQCHDVSACFKDFRKDGENHAVS